MRRNVSKEGEIPFYCFCLTGGFVDVVELLLEPVEVLEQPAESGPRFDNEPLLL